MIPDIGFAVLAALVVFSSGMVAVARNLVHSVFWLAATLIVSSAIMVWLDAPFVAGIQIVLYTGGVVTLMLFAVMLTTREASTTIPNPVHQPAAAGFASTTLLAVLLTAIWTTPELEPDVVENRAVTVQRAFDAHFMVERPLDMPTEVELVSDRPGSESASDGFSEPTREVRRARTLAKLRVAVEAALDEGAATIISTSGEQDAPREPTVRVWLELTDASEASRGDVRRRLADLDAKVVEIDLTTEVGRALLTDHLLAFEALSVLLLAAMIGAIVLSRRKDP